MSAVRDDNRRLSISVAELRADRRAQDRKIKDLEHQLALAKEQVAAPIPQLPIEVAAPPSASAAVASVGSLAPDAPRVVGISDDGGEVIYEGDAALGRPATLDGDDASPAAPRRAVAFRAEHAPAMDVVPPTTDRIEVSHRAARTTRGHVRDVAPATANPPSSDPAGEYRAAVELLKSGRPVDAIGALRAFIQKFPRHDYADNAQYWIGEAYYVQKDFAHALAEFRATIETYPRGNKAPDALLKVGFCYQALGQPDKAKAVLEQVVSLYPKSEPAGLAAKRLEQP